MFAYVDETGNTGENLFDPDQPNFVTAALITRTNFDVLARHDVSRLATGVGISALHASEMGFEGVEKIAEGLLAILKRYDARFFVSSVEKKYLATTKVVDVVFDSYENRAVPWHVYNLRPLKLMLLFALAEHVLVEETVEAFWRSLMQKNALRSQKMFVSACTAILDRVDRLPDLRQRQVAREGFEWAVANAEAITVRSETKTLRYGHLPNMVAFTNLVDGLERQSTAWGRTVVEIKHDRQMQFERSLAYWHDLYSNADPAPIAWPGLPIHSLRKVSGSKFTISDSAKSAGIQVVDVVLWLFGRIQRGDELPSAAARLMLRVLSKGHYSDFSFDNVARSLEEEMHPILKAELSDEQLRAGHELNATFEARRLENVEKYGRQKATGGSSPPNSETGLDMHSLATGRLGPSASHRSNPDTSKRR